MTKKQQAFKNIVDQLLPVVEQTKPVDLVEVNYEEMFLDVEVSTFYNRRKNRYEPVDTTCLSRHEYDTLYAYLASCVFGDDGFWNVHVYYDDSGYDYWTLQKKQSNIIVLQLDVTDKGLDLLKDPVEMRRLKTKYTSFMNMICHYLKELMMSKQKLVYK